MKKILILISIFIICGCSNKGIENTIVTIIEDNINTVVAINYPTTGISELDKKITNYVKNIYSEFKKEYDELNLVQKSELNIDYTYNIIEKYTNISITSFIKSPITDQPINKIESFVYDNHKNKILTLKDIIDNTSTNYVVNYIKNNLNSNYKECIYDKLLNEKIFYNLNNIYLINFDYNYLTIYFNPYDIGNNKCDILKINIPINNLNLLINFEKNEPVFKKKPKYPAYVKDINIDKPVVALTFDDGPSKYTNKILDILNEYDAKATFFVLGNKVKMYEETMLKMIEYENEIGNHSYNHKWMTKLNIEDFKEQINKTQEIINEITGYIPKYFRPTYGSVNQKIKNNTDLKIIMWTIDSSDFKIKNSKKIADRLLKNIKDGDIILMHDTYERTLKAVKIIVPELIKKGYQLVTISTLEEIKEYRNNKIK